VAQLQRSDAHEQREISSGGGMNRPTLMHEEPKKARALIFLFFALAMPSAIGVSFN